MTVFLVLLIVFSSISPVQLKSLFQIQDTLTILCNHFPLISAINDSSLQCARLRIDENIPSSEFNIYSPAQITSFIIIDSSSLDTSLVNININFSQSLNSSSTVNEIRLALLVIYSNFTINNQTTSIYSSYQITIIQWKKSEPNSYNLIDFIALDNQEYPTDSSICQWNMDRWNHIFHGNSVSKLSYAYILRTTNTNLIFTLADIHDMFVPAPYLQILYCIPYKFGTTELVLLIFLVLLFILFVFILCTLHYIKGAESFSEYFLRKTFNISNDYSTYPRTSISSIEYVD